ncbi:bifunctional glycosyltransferase/class I SAM-dependent methyltransferase [bacterium]|nr:bifunctional glycosyltransferase/class I SAM-dependent methyltransferase [bacterium]
MKKQGRILIFIVAYNAEKTLNWVLDRIPRELLTPENGILVIDDSSKDETFEVGLSYEKLPEGIELTVLRTPINQGYGGNQKLGYRYAIEKGFDAVVLLHGDGQYPPELIDEITSPILRGEADAVFGSRMMKSGEALKGGMPLYKYVGNRILSTFQNWWLNADLSEFHSGFRAYSVRALSEVPFENNTSDFHFDTEIIIQFLQKSFRIHEIPIPTYYGDEICHVDGMKYAWDVVKATLFSKIQNLGLFYQRKFDVGVNFRKHPYEAKLDFISSHSLAADSVKESEVRGTRVLDLGCGEGVVARELQRSGCEVTAVDRDPQPEVAAEVSSFLRHDLNALKREDPLPADRYDVILLLDILEHLENPEDFLDRLRESFGHHTPRVIITTGNIGYFLLRFAHLIGQFNYGPRGILDIGHRRLFTFRNLQLLLEESGYVVDKVHGIPAPYPLVLGRNPFSRLLLSTSRTCIAIWKSFFSYQIYIEAKMTPSVQGMLSQMVTATEERRRSLALSSRSAEGGSSRSAEGGSAESGEELSRTESSRAGPS